MRARVDILPFDRSHLPDLYRICLLTGDSGASAEGLYDDPELLGHFYAAPYAVLEPESCFVLVDATGPCGYIVGTTDSARFAARMNTEWLPPLRARLPMPAVDDTRRDARLLRLIQVDVVPLPLAADYPAHLHIDLLPHVQGQGAGRRLMQRFLDHLRSRGVRGVHLGVGARNTRAMRFYERAGFTCLDEPPWGRWYGLCLSANAAHPR